VIVLGGAIRRRVGIIRQRFEESDQLHQRSFIGRERSLTVRRWFFWLFLHTLNVQLQSTIHRQIHRFIRNQYLAVKMGLQDCHTPAKVGDRARKCEV
jgi:hypothetical protein